MISPHAPELGFSPSLSIYLETAGSRFNVESIGGGQLRLRDARPTAAGAAVIHFTIDGELLVYPIELPKGIDPSREAQPFVRASVATRAVSSLRSV